MICFPVGMRAVIFEKQFIFHRRNKQFKEYDRMKKLFSSLFLSAALPAAFAGTENASGIWRFDDPAALLHSSVNDLSLTGYASPCKGIVGGGVHFNGNSEFLELAFTPETQPKEEMTIAFWFKAEPGTDCFPAIRHRNNFFAANGGRGFSWYELTGTKGRVYDGYAHPRELDYNRWYHFALVYNRKELAVYWDGMKIRSVKAENIGAVKPGSTVMIGGRLARYGGKWMNFKGTMDEIEFLKYAKTDWARVRLLKKREQLRDLGKRIAGELSWQERFRKFSGAVETCASDDVAKHTLFPQAEALLKEGENLYHGTDAGFFVKAVSPMRRVMPDDVLLQTPTRKVRVSMAGNERENLQLLVFPQSAELHSFSVELPREMKKADGTTGKFEMKISETEYTPLNRPSHWMYLYPAVPDKLISRDNYPLDRKKFLPLWLEVKSGADTVPGIYSGEIRITADNGSALSLPLEVKVYNFTLPKRNIVPSIVGIWERDLQTYLRDGDVEGFMRLMTAYADMLVEHRLNPTIMHQGDLVAGWVRNMIYPNYRVSADGKAEINWKYYDRLISHLREKGLSTVVMGPYYRDMKAWKSSGNHAAVWREVGRHAQEKGYLADAVAYPIDEWSMKHLDEINRIGKMVKDNAAGVRWLMTFGSQNSPLPEIKNVRLWIPQFHWVNMPEMHRAQKAGIPVWSYVCTGPQFPVPNLHQDTPPAGIRMVPVANFRFGFDGILHWAANFNTGKNAKPVEEYGAGEGRYIYADKNGNPVPTVRLKIFADGMEDWTVLEMLKQRDPEKHRLMLAELSRLIPGKEFDPGIKISAASPREATYATFMNPNAFYPVISHPETYLQWRERLYEMLSSLAQ